MAMSTYQTYLMLGTGSGTITYSKLIDIKDYPDMFAAPEAIDVTTLSDAFRHYIPGIRDAGGSVQFAACQTALRLMPRRVLQIPPGNARSWTASALRYISSTKFSRQTPKCRPASSMVWR